MSPFKRARLGRQPNQNILGQGTGETHITFGCEACPAKRTFDTAKVGGIVLQNIDPPLPLQVGIDLEVEGGTRSLRLKLRMASAAILKLNMTPCPEADQSCPNEDRIRDLVDRISVSPAALQTAFEPDTFTINEL